MVIWKYAHDIQFQSTYLLVIGMVARQVVFKKLGVCRVSLVVLFVFAQVIGSGKEKCVVLGRLDLDVNGKACLKDTQNVYAAILEPQFELGLVVPLIFGKKRYYAYIIGIDFGVYNSGYLWLAERIAIYSPYDKSIAFFRLFIHQET